MASEGWVLDWKKNVYWNKGNETVIFLYIYFKIENA